MRYAQWMRSSASTLEFNRRIVLDIPLSYQSLIFLTLDSELSEVGGSAALAASLCAHEGAILAR